MYSDGQFESLYYTEGQMFRVCDSRCSQLGGASDRYRPPVAIKNKRICYEPP